jgi:polysaccharide pyruvyl transferase WcaK-like protein
MVGWAPRAYREDHAAWGEPEVAQRRVLEVVRLLLTESSLRLRLIAHVQAGTTDDDRRVIDRLLGEFSASERGRIEVAGRPKTIQAAVRQYADLEVLITSRMHAAIFAMAVGTPAIAVAYEPKVRGVMSDIGVRDRVVPADSTLSAAALLALVQTLRDPAERLKTLAVFDAVQGRFGAFDSTVAQLAR